MQRTFQNQSMWEKIAIQYQHLTLFQREKIYLYGISIYRTHATGRSMKAILLRTLTLIIFEWHLISVIAFLSNFEIWLFWQPSIISATANAQHTLWWNIFWRRSILIFWQQRFHEISMVLCDIRKLIISIVKRQMNKI